MITHVPDGAMPYLKSGFARIPCDPHLNEPIEIECRLDGDIAGAPLLEWSVDGTRQPALAGEPLSERYHRFHIEPFSRTAKLSYRIVAGACATQWYDVEILETRLHRAPKRVKLGARCAAAEYADNATLVIDFSNGLTFKLCSGDADVEDLGVDHINVPLDAGAKLMIERNPFSLILMRNGQELLRYDGGLQLDVGPLDTVRSVSQHFALSGEAVFGLGERFDGVNRRGMRTACRVVEKFTQQGEYAYLPVPFFFTELGLGWLCDTAYTVDLDFSEGLTLSQRVPDARVWTEHRLWFGTPDSIITRLHEHTGRPALPPEWAFGVWISGNGWNNDGEIFAQLDALKRYGYPASVLVIEAWSDEQTFYLWNDRDHWADPRATARAIRDAGLHLVLWQIPVVKRDPSPGVQLLADEAEAIEKGYIARNADGTPYRLPDYWFAGSLLMDFTNSEAVKWWFDKRKHLLTEYGVEGFKTDGGEFLYGRGVTLHGGLTDEPAHNAYTNHYIAAYQRFMRENGIEGVTFSRAGFTGAQTLPIHWAGDQLSTWSELRGQLTAGLSAGLSGIPFWSFDIAGFAGPLPSAELYLRATAFAAFCPIMQWHAEPRGGQFYQSLPEGVNNDRSPWNIAAYSGDPSVIDVACHYARLRQSMRSYLYSEAHHCVETGRPMMAHLIYDWPNDPAVCAIDDEYMLGRDLLVAPVITQGATGRTVYLPEGQWIDDFTGEAIQGGQAIHRDCPVGEIPVFRRADPHSQR